MTAVNVNMCWASLKTAPCAGVGGRSLFSTFKHLLSLRPARSYGGDVFIYRISFSYYYRHNIEIHLGFIMRDAKGSVCAREKLFGTLLGILSEFLQEKCSEWQDCERLVLYHRRISLNLSLLPVIVKIHKTEEGKYFKKTPLAKRRLWKHELCIPLWSVLFQCSPVRLWSSSRNGRLYQELEKQKDSLILHKISYYLLYFE